MEMTLDEWSFLSPNFRISQSVTRGGDTMIQTNNKILRILIVTTISITILLGVIWHWNNSQVTEEESQVLGDLSDLMRERRVSGYKEFGYLLQEFQLTGQLPNRIPEELLTETVSYSALTSDTCVLWSTSLSNRLKEKLIRVLRTPPDAAVSAKRAGGVIVARVVPSISEPGFLRIVDISAPEDLLYYNDGRYFYVPQEQETVDRHSD
ncbi:hypothetical protein KQI84_08250 [bacterium]|nr:hypothetical protein [bacterium]